MSIYDKTDIKKTAYSRYSITVTTPDGNNIKARKIIYCNGYESVELIKDKFVKLLSIDAIVGERYEDESYLNDILIWNTARPYIYMLITDDNRILIGGGDEDFVNADKRDSLPNEKQIRLENQLRKILPEYNVKTDCVWASAF